MEETQALSVDDDDDNDRGQPLANETGVLLSLQKKNDNNN